MTTLTPNRILQQGDEYRNNGTWKPVPKEDYGLQVMFTKYSEVRRPDEEPPKETTTVNLPNIGRTVEVLTPQAVTSRNLAKRVAEVKAEPISPVSEKPKAVKPSAIVTATAEKETTPAPTPSGAGEPHPSAYLPTIISRKAHEAPTAEDILVTMPSHLIGKGGLPTNNICNIKFPKHDKSDPDASQPIWTGRNGTFTGYGLEMMLCNGDNVMLSPIGKRGIGNGCIQFPRSVIPQIVDFLLRQQK